MPHHEKTPTFEATFKKDKSAFIEAFLELGKPFRENENHLIHIIFKHVLDESAANSVRKASKIGSLIRNVVVERIQGNTKSIYDKIKKKNNFPLFQSKNSIVTNKSKQKIVSLHTECRLYASLYITCQSRDGDLDNISMYENHLYPPSLSEYGKLRKCLTKSDFLVCLNGLAEPMIHQTLK